MFAGMALMFPDFKAHFGDYYHSNGAAVVSISGFALMWLWLCELAIEKIKMNKAFELLFYWSKNVNTIYIIQWALIMWVADLIIGFNHNSVAVTAALILALTAATHFVNVLYMRWKSAKKN